MSTQDSHVILIRLANRYCDSALEPDESAQLHALLREDASLRKLFRDITTLNAELMWERGPERSFSPGLEAQAVSPQLALEPAVSEIEGPDHPAVPSSPRPTVPPQPRSPVLGFLAGVSRHVPGGEFTVGSLLLLVIVAAFWGLSQAILFPKLGGHDLAEDSSESIRSVASIRETSDVEWSPNHSAFSLQQSEITANQPLSIQSGLIELQLKQGTMLVIEGPANWTIDEKQNAILKQGKLVAKVPRQGVGFKVVTPSAEVVDLGTEFAVEVSKSGETEVHVMQGKVDFYRTVGDSSANGGSKATRDKPATRLRSGEAARADASAPSDAAIDFQPEKFTRSLKSESARSKSRPTRLLDLSKAVATQSSMWTDDPGDFSASSALDGDPKTKSHTTGDEAGQWWQVDLGRDCDVVAVELKNREICCGWLRDIRIKILGDDGKTVLFTSEILNRGNDAFGGSRDYERGPKQLMLDVKRSHGQAVPGRYVRIERVATEVTPEQLPLEKRASVIAAAGKAIVLSEVSVFAERE